MTFNPLMSETFINPASLVQSPPLQDYREDFPPTFFDYGAYPDYDSFTQDALIQHQFCVDTYPTLDKTATSVLPPFSGYFPAHHSSTAPSTTMPLVNQPSISSSVFSDQLDAWFQSQVDDNSNYDAWFQSQVDDHSNHDAFASVCWSDSSAGSQHSHSHHSWTTQPDVPTRTVRPLKRKAEDSDHEDGTSSDCSEYTPSRPAKRIATTRKMNSPLPDSLQPIQVVSATLPRCPLPGCGVELEAKDSAWRSHFKQTHHNDLCLIPGCRALIRGTCKARCPFPFAGCKSCVGDQSKQKRPGAKGAMTIESVGRHLLNVHIRVAFRCPLCGVQKEWRESACARHIRRCAEKHAKKANASIPS